MAITSNRWEAYPWKNELKVQLDRAILHGGEVIDAEFEGEHNPIDMMERAIVLAAFAVRRMVEKRFVSDAFARTKLAIRSFKARDGEHFRPPFHGQAGGRVCSNYDFLAPQMIAIKLGELANEIIHSSQLMVLDNESFAADGFLIASDWHMRRRLLHLSFDEFGDFGRSVLDDCIASASDSWDPETGHVTSERLRREDLPWRRRRSAVVLTASVDSREADETVDPPIESGG